MTRARHIMENIMRFTPPTLAVASLLLMVSSTGQTQRVVAINPRSAALTQLGDVAMQHPEVASNVANAVDNFETALAIDPQNRRALIGLALASRAQGLPGKAIHYFREALALDPNDVSALESQGEAMAEKGAFPKAKENLAKIQALCLSSCPEQIALSNAIAKEMNGAPVSAAQLKLNPVVTGGESKSN